MRIRHKERKIDMPGRREAIKTVAITALATICGLDRKASAGEAQLSGAGTGPYSLPILPYGYDALEPYIDAQTMHLHHDRHHAAYVKNLNSAVADRPDLAKLPGAATNEGAKGHVFAPFLHLFS
jgi:Fe-Mn family superoxide dismutase